MNVVVEFTRLAAKSGREVFDYVTYRNVESIDDAVVKFMTSHPSPNVFDLEVKEV